MDPTNDSLRIFEKPRLQHELTKLIYLYLTLKFQHFQEQLHHLWAILSYNYISFGAFSVKYRIVDISIKSLPQSTQDDRRGCCQFSIKQLNFYRSACTKNNPEGVIAACQKHDSYSGFHTSSPSPPLFFFLPLIVLQSPPPSSLFFPDNPCLSSCCLSPIAISHCHTLHHSSLHQLPASHLPLLCEALQTRHWLLYTMPPCIHIAVYLSLDSPHHFQQNSPLHTDR